MSPSLAPFVGQSAGDVPPVTVDAPSCKKGGFGYGVVEGRPPLRRQRGLYPLMRRTVLPRSGGSGGHGRHRQAKRHAIAGECNRILSRLEQLNAGRLDELVSPPVLPVDVDVGRETQRDVVDHIHDVVARQPPPLRSDEGVAALGALAGSAQTYASSEKGNMVGKELFYGKWGSLPGGELGNFEVVSQLPAKEKALYSDIRQVLRDPREAEAAAAAIPAYLGIHRREYAVLVVRMARARMVGFRDSVKVINGLFGVWKKTPVRKKGEGRVPGGRHERRRGRKQPRQRAGGVEGDMDEGPWETEGVVRVITDMRPGNCYFIEPEGVDLVSPTGLCQLHIEDDEVLVTSKADLDNFFFRCRMPSEYEEYFGLEAITAAELREGGATEDELKEWGYVDGQKERRHPCLQVLPMGWAHSPFIAQKAHEEALNKHSALRENTRLRESKPWGRRKEWHFSYIDDTVVGVICKRWRIKEGLARCNEIMETALAAYRLIGLPVRPDKVSPAALLQEVLGLILDGLAGRVCVCGLKRRRLAAAIRELLKGGKCSGRALSQIVGHVTWAVLCRRPLLCLVWQCYRFIKALDRRVGELWPEVRRELAAMADLLPLAEGDLRRAWAKAAGGKPLVLASDASPDGGGVVYRTGDREVMERLMNHVSVRYGRVAPLHAKIFGGVAPGWEDGSPCQPLWSLVDAQSHLCGPRGPVCLPGGSTRGEYARGKGPTGETEGKRPWWDLVVVGAGAGEGLQTACTQVHRKCGTAKWENGWWWMGGEPLEDIIREGRVRWVHIHDTRGTLGDELIDRWILACEDRKVWWSWMEDMGRGANPPDARIVRLSGTAGRVVTAWGEGSESARHWRITGNLPWAQCCGREYWEPPAPAYPVKWCKDMALFFGSFWSGFKEARTEWLEERARWHRDWGQDDVGPDGPSGMVGLVGPEQWRHWKIGVQVKWKHPGHINVLEVEAETLSASWVLRKGGSGFGRGRRVILFQDSQVALWSGTKGRSSSLPLLRGLRRTASLLLGGNLSIERLWIPSKANPADGPSRGRAIGVF